MAQPGSEGLAFGSDLNLCDRFDGVAVVEAARDAVGAGELEAVEESGCAGLLESSAGEGVQDGRDGHLDGGAVLEWAEVERLAGSGFHADECAGLVEDGQHDFRAVLWRDCPAVLIVKALVEKAEGAVLKAR